MKLYGYWRSSTSYRVRIALNLKGLAAETVPVNLLKGEQRGAAYRALNPAAAVPLLEAEGRRFTQSLAILEYLEETHPQPPILLGKPEDRAYVRALSQLVACDMHPINNLRVLRYLTGELKVSEEKKNAWMQHWFAEGFTALEAMIAREGRAGQCCFGDAPTMADICLVPQLYNARRFGCDLAPYPLLVRIGDYCDRLPAFDKAKPENQADAV